MSAPIGQTCEVMVDGFWQVVSLTEARAHHVYAVKRCPDCHGRVTVAGTYGMQVKLTLLHGRGSGGCTARLKPFVSEVHPQLEGLA